MAAPLGPYFKHKYDSSSVLDFNFWQEGSFIYDGGMLTVMQQSGKLVRNALLEQGGVVAVTPVIPIPAPLYTRCFKLPSAKLTFLTNFSDDVNGTFLWFM